MAVDAAELLDQVSASLDPRVGVIRILRRRLKEYGRGQRLKGKLRRAPAQLHGGGACLALISHREGMPACRQGHGLTTDTAAIDRYHDLAGVEPVLPGSSDRQQPRPLGFERSS